MKQRAQPWNSPVVVFLLVFCLVLATGTLVARELNANGRGAVQSNQLAFVPNWREIASVGQTRGSNSAPIRLVLFADYQCPGCAALHQMLALAADSMATRLQIVTRHFPLSGHTFARVAANAAECAAEQGRFAAFEDVAYQHQDSIGLVAWETFAKRAAIADSVGFSRCVQENRHHEVVDRDRNAALALKLQGTPVYIVNGQPHFGAPSLATLMQQLNEGADHAR
ncbi:MAG: thioredoxin domain-containing protein [Gemmatimonas sp.]